MKEKILIADDEENIRYTFTSFLNDAGYQVDTASTLSQCIQKMQQEPIDLLFLDLAFGDDYGLEAIHSLKCMQPDCAIVIITGNLCTETIIKARKYGALDYLVKPVYQASLLYIVQKTLAKKKGKDLKSGAMLLCQDGPDHTGTEAGRQDNKTG